MKHHRKIVYLAGFLFSVPIALAAYINSSFISSFVGEKLIGIIYTLGSLVSIIAHIIGPRILEKVGVYKFLLSVILLNSLSFATLSFTSNKIALIISFVLGFSLNTLIVFSLDELLKIFSREGSTGKTRGIYIAMCSSAWVLAQTFSGSFLGFSNFRFIYLISFCLMLVFFLISFFGFKKLTEPKYDQVNNLLYIKDFFKNRNLFRAYAITFLLQFFFSWMVIYTPIYLSNYLGFNWSQIATIFAIMLLPFLLIPFHLGKLGDKIGERKILMFGFGIISISTLSLFFIKEHTLFIWAFILFLTRVGGATVEVMSDSYFFKHISSKNEEFVGVYRSASPVAYIIGPLLASLLFTIIPSFKFIYLILGAIILSGIYLSSTISRKDI